MFSLRVRWFCFFVGLEVLYGGNLPGSTFLLAECKSCAKQRFSWVPFFKEILEFCSVHATKGSVPLIWAKLLGQFLIVSFKSKLLKNIKHFHKILTAPLIYLNNQGQNYQILERFFKNF